ncbi:hypothetical protein BPOR_0555g00020 [Botrytis porri]|uniref:Uncharacterized protein n=1 Tax=Botrytis porri TaxID=87229 RepID=A0A4Z1KF09_9HELO|nr:hypothetical protein BPOR_0555g00020 [Botrytis porri]
MNKVLESPETSKEMTTLLTTLLLDLFEKLSTTQPPGNRGWSNHLREALAIFQYVKLQSDIQNGKRARESSLREARELDSILKKFSDCDVRIKQSFKTVPSRMAYGNV